MDVKKETKKKRRVTLFDVALLLLVVIAVAAGAYWVTHRAQTPTAELTYTVRFSGVENEYSGLFAEGKMLYTETGVAMGEIAGASVSRAREARFDSGAVYDAEQTYRYTETRSTTESDITITVKVIAEVHDGGYFVNGNRVAAGLRVDAMVTGYLGEGLILTVEEESV